jgi:superfamily II DNA or RNA helicase
LTADRNLAGEILAEKARLNDLERRRDDSRRRLDELRAAQGGAGKAGTTEAATSSDSWSRERKLQLFERLFRGRPDVFPKRWENAKGRSGWAPCCANEWKPGVCEKPSVKCGECPNQAFVVPSGHELRAHLEGRQVIGVYPLLDADTCRLLAIDLDGPAWRADVTAIREACEELAVQPAVERSRSGQGAHVWFFFSEDVPAASARRFGLMLLTDAMARSPTLTMASYDRLFPSQDVLPKGGFGNLIALPLQQDARRVGNTLFLDERLEPYADQWVYLDSLPLIDPQRLDDLLAGGERDSRILMVGEESIDDTAPWRPARPLADRLVTTTLPETLHATLAQRLYVQRADLPPALHDALRRLACFSNPKFFELQRMRFSTARTPRVISCFDEAGDFLVLPRGCREALEELLDGLGIELELADERSEGNDTDMRFIGELDPVQTRAAQVMLKHDLGVLCAPPGRGKTVIATQMIAERSRSTLVLVHRKPLLKQWKERLSQFLDIDPETIGAIGGGRKNPTGLLDVAMIQSLARRDALEELLADYGHVVVDECHHVPAVTTERVLQAVPARYVTGLTATLRRRDGHHPIVAMQCGPVRHTMDRGSPGEHALQLRVVRRDTGFDPSVLPTEASIQEVYGALADDDERTRLIADEALELIGRGRSPIILTERREHLERLQRHLVDRVPTLVALHGEMSTAANRAATEQLAATPEGEPRLVLATGRYAGEGFDEPRLDTLLLAMPIAWKGTVVQYAGRLHRAFPGKRDALIYDYVDAELPVLRRMFAKRTKAYRSLGYEVEEPQSVSGTKPQQGSRPRGIRTLCSVN